MTDFETIGQRIKRRRKELNLSVDEIAEELGKNRATIYRYENNKIENFPSNMLKPLSKILDTTPNFLIGLENSETIGNKIKSRREELNMTQSALANKLNYKSRSSINKIESGESDIPQSKISEFAKALDTTTSYLMGCNGEHLSISEEAIAVAQSYDQSDLNIKNIVKLILKITPKNHDDNF